MAIDGALGDAWLGRGLVSSDRDSRARRRHMQTAAALEPNRSIFHSTLAKLSAILATKQKQIWSSNVPNGWILKIPGVDLFCHREEAGKSAERSSQRFGKIGQLNDNRRL